MIHIIVLKAGGLQFFHGHIPGQLMDDGGDHFVVPQLIQTMMLYIKDKNQKRICTCSSNGGVDQPPCLRSLVP